jgi:hypothetical protein
MLANGETVLPAGLSDHSCHITSAMTCCSDVAAKMLAVAMLLIQLCWPRLAPRMVFQQLPLLSPASAGDVKCASC